MIEYNEACEGTAVAAEVLDAERASSFCRHTAFLRKELCKIRKQNSYASFNSISLIMIKSEKIHHKSTSIVINISMIKHIKDMNIKNIYIFKKMKKRLEEEGGRIKIYTFNIMLTSSCNTSCRGIQSVIKI